VKRGKIAGRLGDRGDHANDGRRGNIRQPARGHRRARDPRHWCQRHRAIGASDTAHTILFGDITGTASVHSRSASRCRMTTSSTSSTTTSRSSSRTRRPAGRTPRPTTCPIHTRSSSSRSWTRTGACYPSTGRRSNWASSGLHRVAVRRVLAGPRKKASRASDIAVILAGLQLGFRHVLSARIAADQVEPLEGMGLRIGLDQQL
jgi:hypothetical protein